MFNKMAEICVGILDDRLFYLCFYCNIYEMKPDIFEIFRKKFRDIWEKDWEFPETYLGDFSWYLYLGLLKGQGDLSFWSVNGRNAVF